MAHYVLFSKVKDKMHDAIKITFSISKLKFRMCKEINFLEKSIFEIAIFKTLSIKKRLTNDRLSSKINGLLIAYM